LKSNVHVASLGLTSAIGNSVPEALASFSKGHCGIGQLTLFDSVHTELPVGQVKFSNQQLASLLEITKPLNRTTLLGIYAARQAWNGIKISSKWRTGIISGTTVGGMDRTERFFQKYVERKPVNFSDLNDHECGSITERIAADLGITDTISTINTACSSSVNSIMYGARLIQHGLLDVVIAGGVDALTKFTLNGFNSLLILDQDLCKPFDKERNGLNLGEGAGFVVLVSDKVMKEESLPSLCRVTGYANTNDAFHQTASSADGKGSYLAMESALKMSGIRSNEIDYINLHGTGTKNNDSSEGSAVQRLFGEQVPLASSTKSFTGHTLGASGGIEAVFSIMSLMHGCVFPNLRFSERMPEINFDPVTEFKEDLNIKHVMSNSFGFGGNCSSIIFSRA
jgi:3-oxoacyl-[acyl-carrier-protein] synthase-1